MTDSKNQKEFYRQYRGLEFPLKEWINEDLLYKEYLETESRPNSHLYIFSKVDPQDLENEISNQRGSMPAGRVVSIEIGKTEKRINELEMEFAKLNSTNKVPKIYYSHFISHTPTIKALNEIKEIYDRFTKDSRNKYNAPGIIAKQIIIELEKLDQNTAAKVVDQMVNDSENRHLASKGIVDAILGRNNQIETSKDRQIIENWKAAKGLFNLRLSDWIKNKPHPRTNDSLPETLSNLITHEKAPEIVEAIKTDYHGIAGRDLKFMLLALKKLKLVPPKGKDSAFHRCCEKEFDWDIKGYEAMRKAKCQSIQDKKERSEIIVFLNAII